MSQPETLEPGRTLLVGVFMTSEGGIDVGWGSGVEPIVTMCEAIKLLHLQAMQQKQSPILRPSGPLPPVPRVDD